MDKAEEIANKACDCKGCAEILATDIRLALTEAATTAATMARLEEAKWWDRRDTAYETDALAKDQRIAELESELQKLEEK